ncbi:MAG: hypothetical protein UHD09_08890 [Bifidobacterium sp.]|nr:hypothetical protein [Bifidobacterium sp.]
MTTNAIEHQITEALRLGECAVARTHAETAAFSRRVKKGTVVRLYANMYLPTEAVHAMDARTLILHVVRTLQHRHPTWVFTGATAAIVLGLECPTPLSPLTIHTLSARRTPDADSTHLHCRLSQDFEVMEVDGIRVTRPSRTVLEALALHEMREVRGILDSALRRGGMAVEDLLRELAHAPELCLDSEARELAERANPRCENGGESYTDQTIWEMGFIAPMAQVEHIHPRTGATIRTDFEFRDDTGLFVVVELDGQEKYVDPAMTKGLTVPEVVDQERDRQDGLRALGATVVRTWFREVRERHPLRRKLLDAHVPLRRH